MNLHEFRDNPRLFIESLSIQGADGARRFGDVMAGFQRDRFAALLPSLAAVARGKRPERRRLWWEATKGASKDTDLAACMLWLLAFSPRMLTCQAAAADKDQADELRRAAKSILRLNPWLGELVEVQSWSIVNKHTESRLDILASDVAGSHGARPDVLVCNELSHVPSERKEFVENLMDNATKMPGGLVVIATNAGYLGTWQHEWRESARESARWHFAKFAQPAPWLREDDIEEARRRNSRERFNRLWLGQWVSGGGDALDYDAVQRCVTLEAGHHVEPRGHCTYVAALDIGVVRDWSAFVALALNTRSRQVELAHVSTWAPSEFGGAVDLDFLEREVLHTCRRLRVTSVLFDPTEARSMAVRLTRGGVRMFCWDSSPKYQNKMAIALLESIREQRLRLYPHDMLLRDLSKLSIVDRPVGYKINAPRDEEGHCDRGIALAMLLPLALDGLQYLIEHGRRESHAEEILVC